MAGYNVSIFFQREVAGVEQVEIQILEISLVRVRTFSRKNVVVFSPNDECWRLIGQRQLFFFPKVLIVADQALGAIRP